MRKRELILLLACGILFWPVLAWAAPTVQDIVDKAVQAVRSQCYEARMTFLSQMDQGQEQKVRIFHLAPDLYRVEPLTNGETTDWCYIENAAEMVRLWPKNGQVERLPQRQFSLNDDLTVTFLRMLGERGGTSVLQGKSGNYTVYVLRQDGNVRAPYTITVGIDQKTYYPVYLLVNDEKGRKRVFYQMEAIEFRRSNQLADSLFTYKAPKALPGLAQPRASAPATGSATLPLYPGWLPNGYRIEAISVLNYQSSEGAKKASPALVFQCEAYNTRNELISIFQTRSDGVKMDLDESCNEENCGFAVAEVDGWLVTVMGPAEMATLLKIAKSLKPANDAVKELLGRTRERDRILREMASY